MLRLREVCEKKLRWSAWWAHHPGLLVRCSRSRACLEQLQAGTKDWDGWQSLALQLSYFTIELLLKFCYMTMIYRKQCGLHVQAWFFYSSSTFSWKAEGNRSTNMPSLSYGYSIVLQTWFSWANSTWWCAETVHIKYVAPHAVAL